MAKKKEKLVSIFNESLIKLWDNKYDDAWNDC